MEDDIVTVVTIGVGGNGGGYDNTSAMEMTRGVYGLGCR